MSKENKKLYSFFYNFIAGRMQRRQERWIMKNDERKEKNSSFFQVVKKNIEQHQMKFI